MENTSYGHGRVRVSVHGSEHRALVARLTALLGPLGFQPSQQPRGQRATTGFTIRSGPGGSPAGTYEIGYHWAGDSPAEAAQARFRQVAGSALKGAFPGRVQELHTEFYPTFRLNLS